MVQDEDDRRVERDVFQTGNFDALEINPQRDFQKGYYDATYHPGNLCVIITAILNPIPEECL